MIIKHPLVAMVSIAARLRGSPSSPPNAELKKTRLSATSAPITIWRLPNDLLLEIFEHLSGHERKKSRLVCKLFSALITPRLFRNLRYSFAPPEDHVHCRKHGWFEYQPKRDSKGKLSKRPKPCDGSSIYRLNVARRIQCARGEKDQKEKDAIIYEPCPYSGSKTARTQIQGRNDTNPFIDRIATDVDPDANEKMKPIFATAREFTLTLPHCGRIKWRPKGTVTLNPKSTFTIFTATVFPQLLESMPNLETLRIDARPDDETDGWIPFVLMKICRLCADKRPDVKIHVAVLIRDWKLPAETALNIVRSLDGISLLTMNSYWSPPDFDKEIDDLCERCPKLTEGEDMLKEVKYTDTSTGAAALDDKVFIGPSDQRANQWYIPTDEEIIARLKHCRTRGAMDFMMRTWFAFDFDKNWMESVHAEVARLISKKK